MPSLAGSAAAGRWPLDRLGFEQLYQLYPLFSEEVLEDGHFEV